MAGQRNESCPAPPACSHRVPRFRGNAACRVEPSIRPLAALTLRPQRATPRQSEVEGDAGSSFRSLDRVDVDSAEMERARKLLVKTQEEVHRIIYALRPSLLDDLGLSAAMESYAEEHLSRAGLNVSLEIEEDLRARPAIEIPIFRIYQELLTNILRHAEAEHVSIELYEHDRKLILAVEDDGKGFDPDAQSSGVGLSGMRERAALVNASIRFDSEPGQGTHVVVEIPLP